MSPVPIYTPGWRETKWRKVLCLRKQRDGRGLNHVPPDPEFTARPQKPPQLVRGPYRTYFILEKLNSPVSLVVCCHNSAVFRAYFLRDCWRDRSLSSIGEEYKKKIRGATGSRKFLKPNPSGNLMKTKFASCRAKRSTSRTIECEIGECKQTAD